MSAPVKVMMAGAMILALTSDAQAQPPMPSHYARDDGYNSARLWLHPRGHSVGILSYKTCVGQIVGVAKRVGRAIVLKDGACTLNITFNKTYSRAYVKESNCRETHGANCFFDGPMTRQ